MGAGAQISLNRAQKKFNSSSQDSPAFGHCPLLPRGCADADEQYLAAGAKADHLKKKINVVKSTIIHLNLYDRCIYLYSELQRIADFPD